MARKDAAIAILAALAALPNLRAADSEGIAYFESTIRPILKASCIGCHQQANRSSGLALDQRDAVLSGGNRGPAVVPGKADQSLLIHAIERTGDLKMPPGPKLKDEQIAALRKWVDMGAPWPESKLQSKRPGSDYWAFRPVKRPTAPEVRDTAWVRNPIDRFILARLEKDNLKPSPEADKATLLRRASLDLTGLLPTPDELDAFLKDSTPDAYERAVDRLLATPHYGERWGRHWLDIARYADSDGYTIDAPRTMWRYRDYVINAHNQDMPFDRFVIEQMAGDLLPNPTTEQLIATGFHRNTPSNFEGGIDFEQYRVEAIADRVATTGSAFMGLTLGCARCHDHKYDPISQKEFYQLFAFFNHTDEIDNERDRNEYLRPTMEIPTPEEAKKRDAFRAQFNALSKELVTYVRELSRQPGETHKDAGLAERVKNLRALRRSQPKVTTALVMRERETPRDCYIHLGGDFLRRGIPVKEDVPAVLPPIAKNGARLTRLDLAKWLVDPVNPLTPRVTVNRFWQAYFGKGIVETESDFGTQGAAPTHPELLDYLAAEFVNSKWSMKAIHRLIATSAAYRQSADFRQDLTAADPENRLLGRQNRLRLDAEIVRDAALAASGLLTRAVGGPSVYPPIPEGAMSVTQVKREWPTATGPDRYRRGLYTFFLRSAPHPGLMVFDAPDATASCTRRVRSNTPLQALTLLNDDAFIEFAQGLARRVWKESPGSEEERLNRAFKATLGRAPTSAETERLRRLLANQIDEYKTNPDAAKELAGKWDTEGDMAQRAAWVSIARVILNLDDFLTRE